MIDAVLVALLFLLVWVAVLVPPTARGAVSKREAFEHSLRIQYGSGSGREHVASPPPPPSPADRRRHTLGGLVIAIVSSCLLGLLPTFRIMLVVSLLLVNSLLAFVALVVHERDQRARGVALPGAVSVAATGREGRIRLRDRVIPAAAFQTAAFQGAAFNTTGFGTANFQTDADIGLSA